MFTARYLVISVIGFALLLGAGVFIAPLQALPTFTHEKAVQDGAKVTVRFQITPGDSPTTTYSDIEQFVQGQHTVPLGIEQQVAGMQPGETKTFPLSAEEGFGPTMKQKFKPFRQPSYPLTLEKATLSQIPQAPRPGLSGSCQKRPCSISITLWPANRSWSRYRS